MRPTSIAAFEHLKATGQIKKMRLRVAEKYARAEGPRTDHEICQELSGLHINSVNKRIGELIQLGILVELGIRECSVTGRVVRQCDISANPIPLPDKPKRREFWVGLDASGIPVAVRECPDKPMGFEGDRLVKVRQIFS